jgi:hypothetical protein
MYRAETRTWKIKADSITPMEVDMRLKKCRRISQNREKSYILDFRDK